MHSAVETLLKVKVPYTAPDESGTSAVPPEVPICSAVHTGTPAVLVAKGSSELPGPVSVPVPAVFSSFSFSLPLPWSWLLSEEPPAVLSPPSVSLP